MSTYTLTDGIVDAFCAMLKPFVHPEIKLPHSREDGIIVMYNKTDLGLVMFRFIHREELEIQLPLELDRLPREGKDYLWGRIEMMQAQIPKALEERQRDQQIIVYPERNHNELDNAMFYDDGARDKGLLH